jgi:predicted DNA-binding protein YlxM (UPF0122 family)
MRELSNQVGLKYNMLTVLDTFRNENNTLYANCICECGEKSTVRVTALRTGNTKSCGCLQKINHKPHKTHGYTKTPIYQCWRSMIGRCNNKNDKGYKNYGGRGIKVCERWNNFENFLEDMGEKPDGLSIDRIDNDGNYEPNNCRWATDKEQMRNRRNTTNIPFNGDQISLVEVAETKGMSKQALRKRINRGWNIKEAIEKPQREYDLKEKTRDEKIAQERREFIAELSKTCGKPEKILHRRIFNMGFSIEKAITLPVDKQIRVEYKGEIITMSELSKLTGICKSSLWCRIFEKGMSVEEAIKSALDYKQKLKERSSTSQTTLETTE